MTKLAMLYRQFWSTAIPFGNGYLPAFPEYTVASDTPFPYLTYTITQNDVFRQGLEQVRIWTRSANIGELAEFSDRVEAVIPTGGVILKLMSQLRCRTQSDNAGCIYINRGTPFIQRQPMDDHDLQVGYVNLIIQTLYL